MYTDCTNPCTTLTKVGYPDCRKIAKGVTVRSNHVKFFSAGFRLAKQLTKVNMGPQKNTRYSALPCPIPVTSRCIGILQTKIASAHRVSNQSKGWRKAPPLDCGGGYNSVFPGMPQGHQPESPTYQLLCRPYICHKVGSEAASVWI